LDPSVFSPGGRKNIAAKSKDRKSNNIEYNMPSIMDKPNSYMTRSIPVPSALEFLENKIRVRDALGQSQVQSKNKPIMKYEKK